MAVQYVRSMIKTAVVFLGLALPACVYAQISRYRENRTHTYASLTEQYEQLASIPGAGLKSLAVSDAGFPVYYLDMGNPEGLPVLIMNGIHPGEPDGIEASLLCARKWLTDPAWKEVLSKLRIMIIPSYNVDGMHNRGCCSRVNQDGPEEYGFRGNALNLDMNRDFTKSDSRITRGVEALFRDARPCVFIDNHVSNGADYQYTMTLLPTHPDKLSPVLGNYLRNAMLPELYRQMQNAGEEMCPYVHTKGNTPESGIMGFLDIPRFSSGFASLHNCLGFVTETHMLKPFPDRVEATMTFMDVMLQYCAENATVIRENVSKAEKYDRESPYLPLNWETDTSRYSTFMFKGYQSVYETSPVTLLPQLHYDRNVPVEFPVKYYEYARVTDSIKKPAYYIVPDAYREVVARLQDHGIPVEEFYGNGPLEVWAYRITDYKTVGNPYEGHYLHHSVVTEKNRVQVSLSGKYYKVYTGTIHDRLIVSLLEPRAVDGFFAWNFFDGILQQKEWFSDYVWEGLAAGVLAKDRQLEKEFREKQKNDAAFAADAFAQLYWIYKRSPYYESTYRLYPVYRME